MGIEGFRKVKNRYIRLLLTVERIVKVEGGGEQFEFHMRNQVETVVQFCQDVVLF